MAMEGASDHLPPVLAEVRPIAQGQLVSKGTTVARQGDPAAGLYVVRQGLLRYYRVTRDGLIRTLGYAGPADVFGLVEMVTGRRFAFNVRSEGNSELEFFPRTKLMPLIFQRPRLSVSLLVLLGEYTAGLIREVGEGMERIPPQHRLLEALKEMAELYGRPSPEGVVIEGLTVQDLADRTGLSRQWASRHLKGLVERGLVQHSRSRFIVSPQALRLNGQH